MTEDRRLYCKDAPFNQGIHVDCWKCGKRLFIKISKEELQAYMDEHKVDEFVAKMRTFNSRNECGSCEWDGVPRSATFY